MQKVFEKIIEKLEDRIKSFQTLDITDVAVDVAIKETHRNIEIVNQVAEEYNNDYCEWFKYDYRTIAPKKHDVGNPYWRIPENLDKLKFCPYCGKKIKVVE